MAAALITQVKQIKESEHAEADSRRTTYDCLLQHGQINQTDALFQFTEQASGQVERIMTHAHPGLSLRSICQRCSQGPACWKVEPLPFSMTVVRA